MSRTPRSKAACVDTLRLSEEQRQALEAELNRGGNEGPSGRDLRASTRVPYEASAGVILLLYHPGGSALRYLVRPRNISRGGIGFLHGGFVHHNSRCGLVLRDRKQQAVFIWGNVVRCRHIRGHVHEVGVQFEEPIDIERFGDNCYRMEAEQEQSVAMPQPAGSLLYVDGNPDERELMRFHFRELGVELRLASDGRQALQAAEQNRVDLILTELHLPSISGIDTIELLRDQGHTGPIVAFTAETDPDVHDQARAKGCDEVLTKPCSMDRIMHAIVRLLPDGSDDAGAGAVAEDVLISEHWSNQKMRPLILGFLGRLGDHVEQLHNHLHDPNNHPQARKLCLELKSSAGGYGYPTISEAADELRRRIDAGAESAELLQQMQRIEQLCRAARKFREDQEKEAGDGEEPEGGGPPAPDGSQRAPARSTG